VYVVKLNEVFLRGGGDKIMVAKRDTYKYHFKIGNKIVHSGITNDLDRREMEHKQKWSNGHIFQVGSKRKLNFSKSSKRYEVSQ